MLDVVKRMNTEGVPTASMFVGNEIIFNVISSTAYILVAGQVRALNFFEHFPVAYSITSPSVAPSKTQGQSISYRARTDAPDPLFYIVNDGGTGVTINAETGTMSGGDAAPVGIYTITLECANAIGTTGNFNVTWEVTL